MRPVERVRRQLRGVAWLAPTSGFPMLAMNVYPCYLASLHEPSAFDIAGIAFLIRAKQLPFDPAVGAGQRIAFALPG